MKDYYAILGVPRTASQAAIRDAYRRLAKMYHPDVNASPDADGIFKEINEAYEVLGDAEQRAQYDQPTFKYVFDEAQQPKSPPHRDPAYRRPRPPKQKGESEAQRLRRLKLEYKKWFFGLCVTGLCFSILLAIDVALPSATVHDTIVSVKFYQGSRRTASRYEITTQKGSVFRAYHSPNFNWEDDSTIELIISPILSKVLKVRIAGTPEFVWVALVYTALSFFPICLFLASLIGVLGRKNIDLLVNCGTIALVIGLISLYAY